MIKKFTTRIMVLLLAIMVVVSAFATQITTVSAATGTEYKITADTTTGDINKFTYHNGSVNWSVSSSEAYANVTTSTTNPNEVYVEFTFVGNRVEIWGIKDTKHGKVDYYMDGKLVTTVDSYASSRSSDTALFKYGFDDGDKLHTVKIVATGTTNTAITSGNAVIQYSYAKIWHSDYAVTDFELDSTSSLFIGQQKNVKPSSITPSYAVFTGATYTSDNTDVVAVNDNGVMTGISAGNANITISLGTITKSIAVTVLPTTAGMYGAITDTDNHYGQDSYDAILNMNKKSESLTAWRGDTVLSEIAVASVNSALKNVTVNASDFTNGTDIISADNVELSFIKETKAYIGDAGYHSTNDTPANTPSDDSQKVSVPDIITESNAVDVAFNAVQCIWVSVNVPADTKAGTYTGTVTVSADEVDSITFNYTVEVLDAILPTSQDYEFDIEVWQYPYSIAEYYNVEPFSAEHIEILKRHMTQYKELGGYAITCSIVDDAWGGQTYSANEIRYPSMIKWIKQTDGTFTYDYSDFDAWVTLNKEIGIADKIVLYSIASWSGQIRYCDEATSEYVSTYPSTGSTEWTQLWSDFLAKLVAHLEEKGWFSQTYMGIDERGFSNTAFDLIASIKGSNGKSLKTAGAMDNFVNKADLAARVDDLSIGSIATKNNLSAFDTLVQTRKAQGKKTTIYTCTEHFPNSEALNMPVESYWVPMFVASQGAEGFMRWAYDAWTEDPLVDTTHWAFESGDCFLVYPGDTSNGNNTRLSVRLAKLSEGVRDVNKLKLIEQEVPSLKSDIDALYSTIKTSYSYTQNGVGEHGGLKVATDDTKTAIVEDMRAVKETINEITRKYIQIKSTGTNDISSISISDGDLNLTVGNTKKLTVIFNPTNVINTGVTFTSSNTSVATVDANGVVTAVSKGTATITATSNQDQTKISQITVVVQAVSIDELAQIAYYSFDNINGTTVTDDWNNYDGVITGATVVEGKVGNALHFNANDKVVINSPATLDQNWSISMWVKEDSASSAPASLMWDGVAFTNESSQTGSNSLDIRMSNGRSGIHVASGFCSIGSSAPSKGTWNHIVWVNDKSNGISLYLNGQLVATNAWTKNNAFNAPLNVIGGRNFAGIIDEVKVYNKALSVSEISELKKVNGINVDSDFQEVLVGNSFKITAELVADVQDTTLIYTSLDEKVATVDQNGNVTGVQYGDTYVVVSNIESGYTKNIFVRVNKTLSIHSTIPTYEYPVEKQIIVDREVDQYLGQPDLVMLDDEQTIYTVYPKNHGLGATLIKKSTDFGATWSERISGTPSSWEDSQETPTIYKLNFTDGSQKFIIITGCPGVWGNYTTGWNTSISSDECQTWSEYRHFHDGYNGTVAMASLIQLKDEDGNYIDKWMGVFHDSNTFVNYKTYLTFDENGLDQWSKPEEYLSEWRSVESSHQICEVGMFRSPDGNRIVALARNQTHMGLSTMFYSDDEGETWSKPRELPASLLGERHKIAYDPLSGRLIITFREIIIDLDNDGLIESGDWIAGEYVAWVGTYEDLMSGNDGEYRIILGYDYTPSAKSGDTGYAGLCVRSDGTIFTNSYGCFDESNPYNTSTGKANTANGGQAYKTYIMGVQFKLSDIDKEIYGSNYQEIAEPIVESKTATSITLKAVDGYEYRLGNGEWQDSNIFNGLNANTEYKFYQRIKSTDVSEASYSSYLAATTDEQSDVVYGDVSFDNIINAVDATIVLQGYANIITLTANQKLVADVDGNNVVDSADATCILQYYAGIINKFNR